MSYLVIARKYRPAGFASVSGQEHVTRTLANAIKRERVVHAYLFTGPRGVGKTSVARILSKAINCQNSSGAEPCLECQTCREITQGTSLAVREIDGASHNSVDNVRELMDSFKALPPPGYRYKVYIIDEVHMLSLSAFNALLKSLEEPPPNTVFILATTEIHKIPETVISRCQRHDFRSLSVSTIEARLAEIARSESLEAEPEAIRLIARLAEGSMRDAQTLLDRVQSFCSGPITAHETSLALGTVERRVLFELATAICSQDVSKVLQVLGQVFSTGVDPSTVLREFVNFWRELFIAKTGGEAALKSFGLSEDTIVELIRLTSPLELIDVQDLWDVARDGADRCLRSSHARYGFEALAVRLATRMPVVELNKLVQQVTGSEVVRAGTPSAAQQAPKLERASQAKAMQSASAPSLVMPSSSPARSPQAVAPSNSAGLAWEDFLSFVADSGSRMLLENLKRMRVVRFEAGVLEGTGPEFSINSINRDKEKIIDLLKRYTASKGNEEKVWKVSFTKGPGSVDPVASAAKKAPDAKEFEGHPAVQSLQKVFPGSKVEQVKVKSS